MSQTKVKSGLLNFPDQTDFVKLPSGTTAQRPSSPEKGYSRYNTTDNKLEYWNGTIWQQLPGVVPPTIESVSYPGDDLAADPAGGQTITLTGTNFLDGASVEIDGTTASVVTVVSKTEITFTAPAKAAGDYDILLTNGDNTTATFVDGITYNGLPSWTTPAGNLGTFAAGSTIPTITLVATEPDSGVVSYSVTTGALPTGLTLTGADIDGTVPTPAGQTTYNFSVTASDDENQESTERAFNIVVYLQVTNTVDEVDPFGGNGVALYKLDGDATDESTNYNGTWSGTETYSTGVFGQAGIFNGSSYINTGFKIDGDVPFTFSLWCKLESTGTSISFGNTGAYTSSAAGGIGFGSRSPQTLYDYSVGTDYVTDFSIVNYNGAYRTTAIRFNASNTWQHYVGTYDGSVISLYIDGQYIGGGSVTFAQTNNPNNIAIGRTGNTASGLQYTDGSIDQVRIFNEALTPLEVESLYRERTVLCGGQADTLDILGDNSCIATYQLNGNANDLSGNYSGTPTDVSYGVGEFDLAGVFNGTSSFINLQDPTASITTANYSISLWVKTITTSSNSYLISKYLVDGNGATDVFRLTVGSDGIVSWRVDGVSNIDKTTNSTSTINNGSWHHLAAVVETNNIIIYVDGVQESNETGTFVSPSSVPRNVFIGKHEGNDSYFTGSIDQVRIFNKALSAGDVTTLYNETACVSALKPCADKFSDGSGISLYELDSDGLDFNGLYNLYGQNISYAAGRFNNAAVFNGTNSYFRGSNPLYGFNGPSNYSVSAWFKADSFSKQYPVIFKSINNDTGQGPPFVWTDGSVIRFHGYYYGDYNATIATGVWHHVVLVNEGTTIKGYFNGVQVSLSGSTQWGAKNGENFVLGGDYDSLSSTAFDGQIDQVRIFRKALTSSEVTTLYNETACN